MYNNHIKTCFHITHPEPGFFWNTEYNLYNRCLLNNQQKYQHPPNEKAFTGVNFKQNLLFYSVKQTFRK